MGELLTSLINSRLADTVPALVVLAPVGLYMARMLRDAIRDMATAVQDARTREDARVLEGYRILMTVAERCGSGHDTTNTKLDAIAADVKDVNRGVRELLGKEQGGR